MSYPMKLNMRAYSKQVKPLSIEGLSDWRGRFFASLASTQGQRGGVYRLFQPASMIQYRQEWVLDPAFIRPYVID